MIANLKHYDIVLTTAYEFKYGVCGHLFEMIDYYHAIKTYTNLTPCILLADGTTKEELQKAIDQKYHNVVVENVVEMYQPRVIIANKLLLVDGSFRLKDADIFASTIYLFRCSESDFTWFKKFKCPVYLLQDFEVYNERYEDQPLTLVDYKKKILFCNYKQFETKVTDTAMFYLTTVCRALSQEELETVIQRHGFGNNIVLTNNPLLYTLDHVYQVPLDNIWEKFNTYIYTSVPRKIDCSSRFILECMYYGKDVIYDINYYDRALEVRKKDGLKGTELVSTDLFLKLLDEQT